MDMVRVRVMSCQVRCRELSVDECVDVALGTDYAQDFDLDIDLHSGDVDDVAPPTIKLSEVKHYASLLSSLLLENSLYFGDNEMISSQKLVGNIDKMTSANLGKQHQRFLDS